MAALHDPQYHFVLRDQKSGNGGPNQELREITHEVKNAVWQRTLNLPGNAAFTLMRDSPVLAQLDYMQQHIEIYREDANGVEKVFRGKIVQPDYGPVDVVVLCWDYLAFFQRVRVDYYLNNKRKRYSRKKIGFIVDDLFKRSIDDSSIVAFVKKGKIQNPKGDDDDTFIKTGNHFGIGGLQDLLTVFYDLAEMSMSNTDNTVVLEVDESNKFNFYRDRRADKDTIALTFPGTIREYGYMEGWGNTVNDLATLVRNDKKPTSKQQKTVKLQSGRAGIDNMRKLQSATQLGTFLGISKGTKNKGKKVLALHRLAKAARRVDRLVTMSPHQGVFTQFPGTFELGHNLYIHIKKDDGGQMAQYMKLLSVVCGWSADLGETVQMGFREKEVPD
ncbi:MAG: hypothetical protein DRH30_00500 [Deltaproteobacteria bacterium]|nr:MAG: hypothetical protein DRH30_00500 [Deltaproteobacteria bacterium]